jgi:hypothetical protein
VARERLMKYLHTMVRVTDVDPSGTWELKPDPRFEGPPPRLVVHVDGTGGAPVEARAPVIVANAAPAVLAAMLPAPICNSASHNIGATFFAAALRSSRSPPRASRALLRIHTCSSFTRFDATTSMRTGAF